MSGTPFGARLRELRKARGLTQQELAEKCGLGYGAVRDLEQGKYGPTWETVQALTRGLEVSCEEFNKASAPVAQKPKGGRPRKNKE